MIIYLCLFALVLAVKANELGYYQNYDPTTLLPVKSTYEMFSAKIPDDCPPCFNCMLPGFECLHFANCSEYDGKCNCPPGFGGDDCKQPGKIPLFCYVFHAPNDFLYFQCAVLYLTDVIDHLEKTITVIVLKVGKVLIVMVSTLRKENNTSSLSH